MATDPEFRVTYNYDDPTNNQQFNDESRYFPDLIYSDTSWNLRHFAKKFDTDGTTVMALDLTGTITGVIYAKPLNSIVAPANIGSGTVVDAAGGEILFEVDKDVVSASLASYTSTSNPKPIVIYFVIEDTAGDVKLSLETTVRIMDINRDGTEEVTLPDAGGLSYTPEQTSKWTGQYWSAPTTISEALDKLARLDRTDQGSVLSQLGAQPGSPVDADKYLATATAGDWTINNLYEWNSTASEWLEHAPREGDEVYDKNLNVRLRWSGSAWNTISADLVDDTTPQLGGILDTNSQQVRWSKGADVASASALSLGTDGNYFDITGTTTITSINTLAVGTVVRLHFDGILTLTHHATDLILPSTSNITTAVGDHAEFVEYASGDWRCTSYTRADGTALVGSSGNLVDDTTPQLGGTLDTNAKQVRWSKGADVASAGTLTLGTDGNSFDITGTTTITSINTLAVGTYVLLQFDAALTLTHHATDLILPGAANITTAAGDIATFYEYATGDWRCVSYQVAATAPGGGGGGGGGQWGDTENSQSGNYTLVAGDYGDANDKTVVYTGTGGDTFTHINSTSLTANDYVWIEHRGSGTLTIDFTNSSDKGNNNSNITTWNITAGDSPLRFQFVGSNNWRVL